MKHPLLGLSVGAVLLMAQTPWTHAATLTTAAVPLDHMICYKMADPLRLPQLNSTDLLAQLQPEFTQRGCTLVKPIEFCVPATKINVSPVPPDPNIAGQPLQSDYICYLAKCKNPIPPPAKTVIDQFGQRVQYAYHLAKVCVPAQKAPAGCPIGPITKGGPACRGTCPRNTDLCKTMKTTTGPTCACVPKAKPCGGAPDSAGQCGGECPVGDQCLPTLTGTGNPSTTVLPLKCTCRPPTQPICSRDAVTAACGGACPATEKCVANATTGQCDCEPPTPPCQATAGASGAVQCGGACPLQGQTCQPDTTTGQCSCSPPAQCAQDPATGACGGACPAPEVCRFDAATAQCGCGPVPCGIDTSTTPQSCGGACPQGQTCAIDSTGACNCQAGTVSACTLNAANNACGGSCSTPGQTCRPDAAGANTCSCQ